MSEQDTEKTIPRADGPLVTFAILAYNQEKYIRQAVEGAIAQTYNPLEIILSDDSSTDRTLEILKEMASTYRGPKTIVVRQTKNNCGTFLHVAEVASLAKGELLVLAAGDDISKPARTKTLVDAWQSSGAWGLCSRFDRINEAGQLTGCDQTVAILSSPSYPLRQYFASRHNEVKIIHGATSAYDKRLFDFLDTRPEDYILSEDGALSVLLNLLNKDVRMLDDSLVCYRENEQSLTNGSKSGPITRQKTRNDERGIERFARSQANRCQMFLRLQEKYGPTSAIQLDTARLLDEFEKHRMRARWRESSLGEKIQHLLKTRKLDELKWYLPRMLPEPVFIAVKTFVKATSRQFDALLKAA
jgi:cellulose synthase/poly-beta-1,6-N-acetylglucosamine synthase-like glycosyltransferase